MYGSNKFESILGHYTTTQWFPGVQSYSIKLRDTEEINEKIDHTFSSVFQADNFPPYIDFIPKDVLTCLSLILEEESVKVMKFFLDKISIPGSAYYHKQQRGLKEVNNIKKLSKPLLTNFSSFEQMLVLLEYQKNNISKLKKLCSLKDSKHIFSFSTADEKKLLKLYSQITPKLAYNISNLSQRK